MPSAFVSALRRDTGGLVSSMRVNRQQVFVCGEIEDGHCRFGDLGWLRAIGQSVDRGQNVPGTFRKRNEPSVHDAKAFHCALRSEVYLARVGGPDLHRMMTAFIDGSRQKGWTLYA